MIVEVASVNLVAAIRLEERIIQGDAGTYRPVSEVMMCLLGAFIWNDSKEGFDYWNDINRLISEKEVNK
jgi:hypothetical protein